MFRFMLSLLLLIIAGGSAAQAQTLANQWSRADAEELLGFVETIGAEGLDPRDYDPDHLRSAIASGDFLLLSAIAGDVFHHLATDLSQGHVRGGGRAGWHISGPTLTKTGAQALMAGALSSHKVGETLRWLLPRHESYAKLKAELAATPARDKAAIERLRANLERWRWMPRDLGRKYILVNVPAFELTLVEDEKVVDRRKVIVGKPVTPTLQFATSVTGVVLNPWWEMPQSIIAESVGKLVRTDPAGARAKGYVTSRAGGRLAVRQRPGPGNALGQMKLAMPNPYSIYLHDTPNKALFDEEVRAFSHGCIRTQDAVGFAFLLLSNQPQWNRERIDQVLATRATTTAPLDRPIPVYIGYFTAAIDTEGQVASYPDLYGRDGAIVAKLVDKEVHVDP